MHKSPLSISKAIKMRESKVIHILSSSNWKKSALSCSIPSLQTFGGGRKKRGGKKRGSNIKSGECDNFNNIITKVTRLRHKLENQEMTMNH